MKGSDQHFATCEKMEKRNKRSGRGNTGDPQLSNSVFYPLTRYQTILLAHFRSDTEEFCTI